MTDLGPRLAAALDSLASAVAIADEHGVVVFRNGRARAMAGARDADVLAARAAEEQLEAGRFAQQTLDLFGPPPRSFVISTQPLQVDGRVVGAVAVVDDITERRQIEAMRRDFVANVSHELRTPVGALGVLAETLTDESDPKVIARLSARIAAESDRAASIIDDLLDLSRLEGTRIGSRQLVELSGVIAGSIERVSAAAAAAGVTVSASEATDAVVLGDGSELVSAVTNLLDNAVKYSDAGSEVRLVCETSDDEVRISVIDQGIGIPARDVTRIFERFYRVDRARSRQSGGTGLGLAIVKHVTDRHDGSVEVASREGEGSTFTLRFPRVTP